MVQINNGAGAWLVSVPQTSDAISHTGLTLVKKAQAVGTITLDFPVGSESGDTEYAEMTLGNGVTMKIATRTTAVDSSGNAMAASTSDAFPSVTVEIFDNDTTFIKALNDIGNKAVLLVVPLGESNADGYCYILGRIASNISVQKGGNSGNAISVQVQGKVFTLAGGTSAAQMVTAITTLVTSITQYGTGTVLDPSVNVTTTNGLIAAGDVANPGLLAGTYVIKQGT